MRVDDIIYFCPGVKAIDIDFSNTPQLIDNFQSRIENYYFEPAIILNDTDNAFGAGVIIMAAVDAITYYSIGGNNRIKDFFYQLPDLKEYNNTDKRKYANAFDSNFRNGLIHEGRIKNAGQFSYAYGWLLTIEHDFMIINPRKLQTRLQEYFYAYLESLRNGQAEVFINKFTRQFQSEVGALIKHYRQE